jgi:hypothetical protein
MGDLHGTLSVLDKVLLRLDGKPGCRLFIAGDLVDRGADNVALIRTIVWHNNMEGATKIYAVRGNHEDLCLKAIAALEKLMILQSRADDPDYLLRMYMMYLLSFQYPNLKEIINDTRMNPFLENLIDYGRQEFIERYGADNDGSLPPNPLALLKKDYLNEGWNGFFDELSGIYYDLKLHEDNGGDWLFHHFLDEIKSDIVTLDDDRVIYEPESNINMVKEYLTSLPYIIHVNGVLPFNVVHADMPHLSDKEVQRRILMNMGLTDIEIRYAIWARDILGYDVAIVFDGSRCWVSIPTYVGHSICGGVRANTNTMNLDIGAYDNKDVLLVNHTDLTCIAENSLDGPVSGKVLAICDAVQEQLDKQVELLYGRELEEVLGEFFASDAGVFLGQAGNITAMTFRFFGGQEVTVRGEEVEVLLSPRVDDESEKTKKI